MPRRGEPRMNADLSLHHQCSSSGVRMKSFVLCRERSAWRRRRSAFIRGSLLQFVSPTTGALLAVALGCASQGAPPGGAPDSTPPEVLHITPDTGAVNVKPARVVFRFDEVVSERPQGATSLRDLFIISPRQGEPDVDWRRDAITVRARRGWRANTVYTVTMLPGLTDLRGN